MCSSAKAPKAAPPQEPLKNIDQTMSGASNDAAISQARRRGLASVWTRYNTPSATAPTAPAADKAEKLGG